MGTDGGPEQGRGDILSLLSHQDGSSIFHLGRSIVLAAIGSFPSTEAQWLFVEKLLFRGKQGFYLPTGRASAVGGERGEMGFLAEPSGGFFL